MPDLARIQRRRARGYQHPPGTLFITRGTLLGNPHRVGDPGVPDAETAVALYREDLYRCRLPYTIGGLVCYIRAGGYRHVACYCRIDQCCHGDVIIEVCRAAEVDHAHD